MKKTIIDKLIEANVCFAVCVSTSTFKVLAVTDNSKDYFIIAKKDDVIRLGDFNRVDIYDDIVSKNLTEAEIVDFKRKQSLFIKVQHDENGRVYELKGNSFKQKYKL